jgi:hypothetical protein
VDEDPNDPRSAIATINYALVATQAPQRIDLRVALA